MAGKSQGNLQERAARAVKKAAKKIKGAPKSKAPGKNNTPCRQRYWASHRLEERKIRALVKYCGLTHAQAYVRWHDTRKGRIKK